VFLNPLESHYVHQIKAFTLNLLGHRRDILSPVRLPIPPLGLGIRDPLRLADSMRRSALECYPQEIVESIHGPATNDS